MSQKINANSGVKIGDILKETIVEYQGWQGGRKKKVIRDYKVIGIYSNHVLAQMVDHPEIRRSFTYGDLVVQGAAKQSCEYEALRKERNWENKRWRGKKDTLQDRK